MAVLLINSLVTAGMATLLATLFGLATGLVTAALPGMLRRLALVAALVALAMPPFLVANCWLYYLGNVGVWRSWLPVNIFTIWGAAWLLSLMLWPISFLAALSAWRGLDRAHLESEPAMRGINLLRWLLWPAARKSVSWAAVLTSVLALNQFAIPGILQVKVLPVEIWIRYSTSLRPDSALAVSWPVIVVPIAMLLLLPRMDIRWPAELGPTTSAAMRRQLGTALLASSWVVAAAVLFLSVGLPLFQLISASRTWAELPRAWNAGWPVILNSFLFAAMAALVAVALAVATWRTRIGWAFWIPFLLPGMLVAVAVIWLLNRPFLEVVYRSMAVMILMLVLRFIGPVWTLVGTAFRTVDRDLIDAGKLEDLHGWRLFRHVYWPRVGPFATVAWYVAYVLSLWDVETTAVLYPPGAETLAIRVFNLLHYGHDAQVNALCLV
ncbi:MAG TPA: hypothetical protein VK615_16705, partial [Candidatus Binatia bacterium]|nr:hypothetical protein [Candidatus Binatia bacterium]